jgi:hypothetical protein
MSLRDACGVEIPAGALQGVDGLVGARVRARAAGTLSLLDA